MTPERAEADPQAPASLAWTSSFDSSWPTHAMACRAPAPAERSAAKMARCFHSCSRKTAQPGNHVAHGRLRCDDLPGVDRRRAVLAGVVDLQDSVAEGTHWLPTVTSSRESNIARGEITRSSSGIALP